MSDKLFHVPQVNTVFSIILLFLLTATGTSSYAEIKDTLAPQKTKHLAYKHSLFNYYQGKYFSAISNLLVAEKNKQTARDDSNIDFLLGSSYLSYGLYNKAAETYKKIISKENLKTQNKEIVLAGTNRVLDRAWLQLGKTYYQNGLFDEAEKALYAVTKTLNNEYEDERLFMLANIYLQSNRLREAKQALDYFRTDSIWSDYTTFNIGAQSIKNGATVSGIKYLKTLTEKAVSENRERRILQDKANIALGYTFLKHKQAAEAGKHFESVRLNDTESTNALLGSGLSWYMQSDFQKTLAPWIELSNRKHTDPYVQEALITLPNSFEKTNNLQQALHQYDIAVDIYQQQLMSIEASITTLTNGKFIRSLKANISSEESATPVKLLHKLNTLSNQYLLPLISTTEFHKALKSYQETARLNYTLNHWQQSLPSFEAVLEQKSAWYNSTLTNAAFKSVTKRSEQHHTKAQALSDKLYNITNNEEILQLATPEEQKKLDMLHKAKEIINKNKDVLLRESEKQKLLFGLMYWELTSNHKQRSLQAQNKIQDLETAVNKTDKSINSLDHARKDAPELFSKISSRIKGKLSQIKRLKKNLAASLKKQEKELVDIALLALDKQRDRLILYSDRAAFSRARLYDSLADKNSDD